MDYKVLVLDIDGTLLNSQNQISQATYERLIQLQEDGYYLVLASGRPTASMLETAKQLKLSDFGSYIISYNGAEITELASEKRIYRQVLSQKEQGEIIQFLKDRDLSIVAYKETSIVIDRENEHSEVEAFLTKLPSVYDEAYFEDLQTPQLKFIGVGPVDKVQAADQELGGKFGQETYATTSLPYFLEFMHESVSKGKAIAVLGELLGFTMDQVVACGDGNNDASMIEDAGLGIAMGNATDYLKSLADEITLSNDEEGLIPVMNQYFPRK